MSSENDVPLGEGARRYYEQQFGDRIQQIQKTGGSTPQRNNGGSGWGGGRAGCGVIFAVIFFLRLIFLFVNTQSSKPSYDYSSSSHAPFHGGIEILEPDFRKPNDDNFAGLERLLTEADVPLLEGLCYRIDQESRQIGATPGKRICTPLPHPAREHLVRVARGERLRDDEQLQLLLALDTVLHDPNLYDGPSFENVPGALVLVLLSGQGGNPVKGTPRFNRLLLEKCYPRQIVPLSERRPFDAKAQAEYTLRAQRDLEEAHKEHERAIP